MTAKFVPIFVAIPGPGQLSGKTGALASRPVMSPRRSEGRSSRCLAMVVPGFAGTGWPHGEPPFGDTIPGFFGQPGRRARPAPGLDRGLPA